MILLESVLTALLDFLTALLDFLTALKTISINNFPVVRLLKSFLGFNLMLFRCSISKTSVRSW